MAPKLGGGENQPHGDAYSVKIDGTLKKLWSTSGWYELPSNIFLDRTGQYLVRITEPPELDDAKKLEELKEKIVLSFYDKGELIKSYKFKDIVDDALRSVSFRINSKTFVYGREFRQSPKICRAESLMLMKITSAINNPHLQVFLLETREGKAFVFDIQSGKILHVVAFDTQSGKF
jgi:hypothetical protein